MGRYSQHIGISILCASYLQSTLHVTRRIACVRMSEAIENPYAYTRLTDHVIQQILMSTKPELEEVGKY